MDKDLEIKPDTLSSAQAQRWLSRAKTTNRYHRKQMMKKYKQAKRRYNSEIGFTKTLRSKATHTDINILFKDNKDFQSAVFYRNPRIDLTAKSEDEQQIRAVENLEQKVNDDIQANRQVKPLIRSLMTDEYLSGIGVAFIDYEFRSVDAKDEMGNPIPIPSGELDELGYPLYIQDEEGEPIYQQRIIKDDVVVTKIRPENLIRPKNLDLYNYQESPFLGYIEIESIDKLKADDTLNQGLVSKITGKEYSDLMDVDLRRS